MNPKEKEDGVLLGKLI